MLQQIENALVLNEQDRNLIRSIYDANTAFGGPMLPDPQHFARAAALAEAGLLDATARMFPDGAAYVVTDAGVEAYNAALPQDAMVTGSVEHPPVVPKGVFATREATVLGMADPHVPAAYWLEIENADGDVTDSLKLCEAALDLRCESLNQAGLGFSHGEETSEMFYRCQDTGRLMTGSFNAEPETLDYSLSGFAWRRESGFAMLRDDWTEAAGFISAISDALCYAQDLEDGVLWAVLKQRIIDSCFLPVRDVNESGIWNPGAFFCHSVGDLIKLFDVVENRSSGY
ncbi:MAG: hypothetical protein ACYDC8_16930 [Gammaproteobacteria bacterium]